MMKQLKIAAIGALAAAGVASAAFAQQPGERTPAERPMDRQMMGQGDMMGMMGTMNDPEMRRQMTEMMSNCNRMMARMGDMSAPGQTRR